MSTRNDITTSNSSSSTQDQRRAVQPAIDVFETDASITLLADMPGVPRDQLEIQVEGDSLLIQGEAKPQIAADLEPLWAEVRTPRFRRSFTLSRELDTSRIEANLKDGVLTLRIPKHAQAQPRRIPVSA
jgi:HSP20 family protein